VRGRELETRRGIRQRVHEAGRGEPLLYLHGEAGLLDEEPLLERLAARFHVLAPEWPGYGESEGEERLEDMLDFALHGWDVAEALGLPRPRLVGHSMGGMIAAEMAALAPRQVERLGLLAPLGLWIDDHPVADLFAHTPFELPGLLFHDAARGERLLAAGLDFRQDGALEAFMVRNARRLGTAGKILFPIPNRRLAKRLYRLTAPTLLVWGREDRLVPPVYAERFRELLPDAAISWIDAAGHMLPYEAPEAAAEALTKFLA
jgi:pimeloyl-ACP methyl ester carboxylesterase